MSIYDRSVSTADFLNEQIKRSKDALKIEHSGYIKNEEANAKLLQDFFNTLAGFTPNEENLIDSIVYQEVQAFMESSTNNSFVFNDMVKKKKVTNVKFEKWLASVINQTFKQAALNNLISSKENINLGSISIKTFNKGYGAKVLGSDQVHMGKNVTENLLGNMVDDTAKDLLKKCYNYASQKITYGKDGSIDSSTDVFNTFGGGKTIQDLGEEKIRNYWHPQVSGKIDVATNFAEINIQVSEDSKLQKILKLLQKTSFSLKGYSTDSVVRIGSTNPYRVFLAVTSSASAKEKSYRWARMLNCMDLHSHHEAGIKFYTLRYLYELTGYGAQYTKNLINNILGGEKGAEYIVYYREGQGIRVLSTSAIYKNFLELLDANKLQVHKKAEINNKQYALYSIAKLRFKEGASNKMSFELE